jgi:hypothetical protein
MYKNRKPAHKNGEEKELQLSMVMRVHDTLRLVAAGSEFREDLALEKLANDNVESSAGEICCSDLESVS